jgi:hypothetical protein
MIALTLKRKKVSPFNSKQVSQISLVPMDSWNHGWKSIPKYYSVLGLLPIQGCPQNALPLQTYGWPPPPRRLHVWQPRRNKTAEKWTLFKIGEVGGGGVWERTRVALWNTSYLLLTREINRSKTEIQRALSAASTAWASQRPLRKKACWRLTFHVVAGLRWAGAAALASRPLHVLLPSLGRSAQLAGDSQRGESPGSNDASAQIEGAGARDLPAGARGYSGAGWRRL